MPLLSAAQLTQIRAQQTASLDQTCSLRTPGAIVSDGAGGWTNAADSDTSVACRVAPPSGREREIAARLGQEVDAVITLAHSVSVDVGQSVVVGDRVYEVTSTNQDESYRTATRLLTRKLS